MVQLTHVRRLLLRQSRVRAPELRALRDRHRGRVDHARRDRVSARTQPLGVKLRREFLRGVAATLAFCVLPAGSARAAGRLRFMALGQAAIQSDLRERSYPGFAPLASFLAQADVCFTDLETPISGPGAETATRDTIFLKAAAPAVLDCLKSLSINVLALSNNHAWDFGTGGILATLNAVRARGFA